ncbi:MAG: class I SAM-dependent methyltransferase [Patescibacteria group bacterium]
MKPTNTEIAQVFDRIAGRYDQITNQYALDRRREFIVAQAFGDCLEVGAGTGEIARFLTARHRVVVTDISSKMVEELKQKFDIDGVVADAEHLPFESGSFDTVIATEVIYYLDHPEKFIDEAYRVLRPGGRLLIVSATTITRLFDGLRWVLRKLGVGHMYFDDPVHGFFSTRRLRDLIGHGGFHIPILERAIIVPFVFADSLNRVLEKIPLVKYFGIFVYIRAEKK